MGLNLVPDKTFAFSSTRYVELMADGSIVAATIDEIIYYEDNIFAKGAP